MGRNFIHPDIGRELFRPWLLESVTASDISIPFTKVVLHQHQHTHCLVLVEPVTIFEIRACVPELFWEYDRKEQKFKEMWYDGYHFFAHDRGAAQWSLVRKGVLTETRWKYYSEQTDLIPVCEQEAKVREVIYTMVVYYQQNKERICETTYAQCADRTPRGNRIAVGVFDGGGMHLNAWADEYRFGNVGVATCVRPEM
jgi:hypothetical protein